MEDDNIAEENIANDEDVNIAEDNDCDIVNGSYDSIADYNNAAPITTNVDNNSLESITGKPHAYGDNEQTRQL